MRKDITVAAEVRASRGKNEARRTRRAGQIPAVVYGAFQDPVSVAVDPRAILKIVRSDTGYNTIFNLAIAGGETTPVMVVDQQVDPVRGTLLHVDLKRIDLTKRIRVTVPVHTTGEPKGVKVQGGLARSHHPRGRNRVPAGRDSGALRGGRDRADDRPEQARERCCRLTGSMKLLSAPDTVIAHVVALRAEEVAPAAEADGRRRRSPAPPSPKSSRRARRKRKPPAEEKGKKK